MKSDLSASGVTEQRSTHAPIALFVYRRPEHVRRTIAALQANEGASESDLIVFSDAATDDDAQLDVGAVREYLRTVTGFRSVRVIERPENFGLAKSIIGGVTQVLDERESVIVVEDDLVTSPYFLRYMNDGIRQYEDDERVVSVHGYMYPVGVPLPETFFLRGADCWGWATWRQGWSVFNPNGRELLDELRRRNLTGEFDFDGTYGYTKMLEDQIAGRNNSWAVRWYASAFLRDKLTLYPGRSLVNNIGNDATGTHSGITANYDVAVSASPVGVGGVEVAESSVGRNAIVQFGRRQRRQQKFRSTVGNLIRRVIG